VRAAALIMAGWYDPFLPSDIAMWKELRARGRPARLIIGPWGHNLDPQMPGMEFGPSAPLPLRQMEIDWFDAWLRQSVPPAASVVFYYVMGAGQWRESAQWPPEGVETEALYLESRGAANSLRGDGRLQWKPPAEEAADRYDYDPKRAVPTVGGANCCNFGLLPWGPLDQRPVEGRRDVLVYTGETLREPLEIAGPVRAVLHVSTSAPDTDFTAKLVDAAPDGPARILTDGILRLRYREGIERAVPYRPGTVVEVEIDMGHTAHEFPAGHAVRLEVSSSNFPRYDRNLNTGRLQALETQMRVARQAVWHGPERPSRLQLPVLRRGAKAAQGRLVP
jgi:putative CocE/NonD family hydrolase